MSLGGPEILVILIVALLVFGPHRLPEIGRQLGKAMRELRKIEHTVKTEITQALDFDSETGTGTDAQAPYYGDPTNVPDGTPVERPEAGALAEADEHTPPPASFFEEPPDSHDDASEDVALRDPPSVPAEANPVGGDEADQR